VGVRPEVRRLRYEPVASQWEEDKNIIHISYLYYNQVDPVIGQTLAIARGLLVIVTGGNWKTERTDIPRDPGSSVVFWRKVELYEE
jgi:hypothetical protein